MAEGLPSSVAAAWLLIALKSKSEEEWRKVISGVGSIMVTPILEAHLYDLTEACLKEVEVFINCFLRLDAGVSTLCVLMRATWSWLL